MAFETFWGGAEPLPAGQSGAAAPGEHNYDSSDDSAAELDYFNPQTGEEVSAAKRKRRVLGGIAPVTKRITLDYDSDDARLIELKRLLYTDEAVAEKFKEEGRVRYQPKTIGSRWVRLRQLLLAKEDERLDDELSDWHVGEDDVLRTVEGDVEKKIQELREKLEQRKWQEVSQFLGEKMGKRKYTAKACKERLIGLDAGTALRPIEEDSDQPGRRKMREERVARAKQLRRDTEEAKRKKGVDEATRRLAQKQNKLVADEQRAESERKRKAEKEERARVARERKTNKDMARKHRKAIMSLMRAEHEWELTKRRKEDELCKRLTGISMGRRSGNRTRRTKDGYESEEAEESDSDDQESDEAILTDSEDDAGHDPNRTPATASKARRCSSRPVRKPVDTATNSPAPSVEGRKKTSKTPVNNVLTDRATVTQETLLNPRSILSIQELDLLLMFRDLPRRNNESHAEVVARLAAIDQALNKTELEDALASRGEVTKGKKADLLRRLQEADANKSDAGQMGVKSTDLDFMQRYDGYSGEFAGLAARADGDTTIGNEDRRDSAWA